MLSEWELRTRGGFPLGVLSPGEEGVKSRLGRPFVKCYPTAKLDDCHFQHQPRALGLAGLERPRRESVLTGTDCRAHLGGLQPFFTFQTMFG